jgi:hypothetical protein
MESPEVPPLLCEHGRAAPGRGGHEATCPACGSFWDLDARRRQFVYDESYVEGRAFQDRAVQRLKVRTLRAWLRAAGIDPRGLHVCEVGFGHGACLEYLCGSAACLTGIEANAASLEYLRAKHLPLGLFAFDRLPERLARPVDLWLFQDSFEHIPTPASFVDWLARSSAPTARILLVAPEAASLSQRLMGSLWPHRVPDHPFHWSRRGLVDFFARRGFSLRRSFFPIKFVSPAMASRHLAHKLGRRAFLLSGVLAERIVLPFNVGEMGLVLARG